MAKKKNLDLITLEDGDDDTVKEQKRQYVAVPKNDIQMVTPTQNSDNEKTASYQYNPTDMAYLTDSEPIYPHPKAVTSGIANRYKAPFTPLSETVRAALEEAQPASVQPQEPGVTPQDLQDPYQPAQEPQHDPESLKEQIDQEAIRKAVEDVLDSSQGPESQGDDGSTPINVGTGETQQVPVTKQGQSQDVTDALSQLLQNSGRKTYQSAYADAINDLVERLAQSNYDNWAKSATYDDLYNRYARSGRLAMQDTLGQVSARTGGLSSSWGASVAQQAYNDYMNGLETAARGQYDQERQEIADQLGIYQNLENRDYSRWQDEQEVNRANTDRAVDYITRYGFDADDLAGSELEGLLTESQIESLKAYFDRNRALEDREIALENKDRQQEEADRNRKIALQERDMAREDQDRALELAVKYGMTADDLAGSDLEGALTENQMAALDRYLQRTNTANGETGADDNGYSQYLNDMVASGSISQDEAIEMYSRYMSNKYNDSAKSPNYDEFVEQYKSTKKRKRDDFMEQAVQNGIITAKEADVIYYLYKNYKED